MKNLLTLLAFGAATLTAAGQTAPAFKSSCDEHKYNFSDNKQHCETRDFSLKVPKSGPLTVDGGKNGGIAVRSYPGSEVKVRARVQTWGADEAAARSTAAAVHVNTVDGTMRATSTAGDNWAVSYELLVPEKMALALKTQNGGISLDGVKGLVTFEAQNGGVSIVGTGGDVKGSTKNGGLSITLNGRKWEGKGLDVTTTNGGISWKIPADYSAELFSSTVRGPISTDFPTDVKGKVGREIAVALGKGGSPIRAVTTNGGITIKRGTE
ncbi:DUF4097 domain-containing protein [Hymenobacter sp. BT175]|uniref:DUF4097 family beta strand repeat-containing protein n=1 Tax=Hymenobacter translucens TaxID=2886507 RepID=UPI001D0DDF4E|nr:DUF4097 domain-containing protein [Hymenobacter translucens]MCC2545414.1 DUF4097 domain-containing protein [Hymenobacter translucens]